MVSSWRVSAAMLLCLIALGGCAETTDSGSDAGTDAANDDDAGPVLDGSLPPSVDVEDAGSVMHDAAVHEDAALDAASWDGGVVAHDGAVEDAAFDAASDSSIEDGSTADAELDASDVDGGDVDGGDVDGGDVDGGGEPDPEPLPSGTVVPLGFGIVDAEYSRALDRIVLVTATGSSRVIVLDPEAATSAELALPFTPTCVSVHPDGTSAVIGHDGYLSVVELDPLVLVETWPISTVASVVDVVLAGDGHAYVFSYGGDAIRIVEVSTGDETLGDDLFSFTVARLHPEGNRMYGAERNVSPSDFLRIGIAPGSYSYGSIYHGEYQTGRDLWISEDGTRIFGASGEVFSASDVRDEDMRYRGSLEGRPYTYGLDHASVAGLVAAVHVSRVFDPSDPWPLAARLLSVYEDEFLNIRQTVTLPSFRVDDTELRANGRFVFFRSDGRRLYALVDDTDSLEPAHHSALVRYSIEDDEDLDPIIIDDPPVEPPVPVATPSAGAMLDFNVNDAEYDRVSDRLVIVTPDPDRLIALDPTSGAALAVTLPMNPSSVAVGSDGATAAVGHDAYMSVVDLESAELVQTLPVSIDVFDVVLAGNGYAYSTPASTSDWYGLYGLELATGEETSSRAARHGTRIRLHPAGDRIYGADNGVSPGDIERYGIAAGAIGPVYDSPYHGDYDMGGDLWFSEDGQRIFTPAGNVFVASNVRMDDMTYEGALEIDLLLQHLDHSAAAGLLAAVTRRGDALLLLDDATLEAVDTRPLPDVTVSGRTYPTVGRFAFFSASGAAIHVIAEAVDAPIAHNDVLVTFEP